MSKAIFPSSNKRKDLVTYANLVALDFKVDRTNRFCERSIFSDHSFRNFNTVSLTLVVIHFSVHYSYYILSYITRRGA